MNRTTLVLMMIAAATVVGAQEPPTPPARPVPAPVARPARPADAPSAPAPAARALTRPIDSEYYRDMASEAARADRELSRINADIAREAARAINADQIAQARELSQMAREQARALAPLARDFEVLVPPMALQMGTPMAAPMAMRWSNDFPTPRPFYTQGEPEDSVYRLAHDVFNRGDYGRAAQMFKDIAQKYPKSVYSSDLSYYEALARYKIGTTDELRVAAKLLEPRAGKLTNVSSSYGSSNTIYVGQRRGSSDGDVAALYTRINSALASRGDRDAADRVTKLAQAGANTCDRDEMGVRIEAMSALTQMDPTKALPIIRKVLDNKDECTNELRQRAVFILGRRGDADAAGLISNAAKSDPSKSVRIEAINWLPKLQGDAGVAALEDLLRTESDENIQRSIVRTLVSSDNPKARSSMRALIDRKDAPVSLRVEAINSFNNDRVTAEDAAYLRNLYPKADNDRVKDAIVGAVARIGGSENEQWLIALSNNTNEPSQLRASAISRLARSNITIGALTKLYDVSDTYNVRMQIVNVLGSRKEPEATDKLIDIVKNSTDRPLRLQVIQILTRKNDPRANQILLDLVDGTKKP